MKPKKCKTLKNSENIKHRTQNNKKKMKTKWIFTNFLPALIKYTRLY